MSGVSKKRLLWIYNASNKHNEKVKCDVFDPKEKRFKKVLLAVSAFNSISDILQENTCIPVMAELKNNEIVNLDVFDISTPRDFLNDDLLMDVNKRHMLVRNKKLLARILASSEILSIIRKVFTENEFIGAVPY
ncbi:MAG: hypothetical protein ACP6IS_11375 [Candidatus Asgardarchaeia archaeon]